MSWRRCTGIADQMVPGQVSLQLAVYVSHYNVVMRITSAYSTDLLILLCSNTSIRPPSVAATLIKILIFAQIGLIGDRGSVRELFLAPATTRWTESSNILDYGLPLIDKYHVLGHGLGCKRKTCSFVEVITHDSRDISGAVTLSTTVGLSNDKCVLQHRAPR